MQTRSTGGCGIIGAEEGVLACSSDAGAEEVKGRGGAGDAEAHAGMEERGLQAWTRGREEAWRSGEYRQRMGAQARRRGGCVRDRGSGVRTRSAGFKAGNSGAELHRKVGEFKFCMR